MFPGATESSKAKRHQDTDGNHARIAQVLFFAGFIDESAKTSMGLIMDKVDQVIGDGMEARGEGLVLDEVV